MLPSLTLLLQPIQEYFLPVRLPLLQGGVKRVSSYDREEGTNDFFNVFPGQSLILADIKEPGTIKRFFIKVDSDDPNHLRSMLLKFYWDDSEKLALLS